MPAVKATALAYVRIQVQDLDESERFFNGFGLATRERRDDALYLAGTGPEHHLIVAHTGPPKLIASAFEVSSARDLHRISTSVAGASAVVPRTDAGGGLAVMLRDPDGNAVEVVHGIARCAPVELPSAKDVNTAANPLRRRNQIMQPETSPSHVLRIGHVVMKTPSVERTAAWYAASLGFIASDDVLAEDGEHLVMSFVRLDRGRQPVDHHVMQFLAGEPNRTHHISFEVQDLDDLYMGHDALVAAGYEHVWGIGRHLQGSQIFDYWLGPDGTMYEHWTDSDRFDASVPKGVRGIHGMAGPWGPPMPEAFIRQASQ
jgi:catechol-2,3-dioxygenase